jgi:hypothetical protein
LDLSLQSSKCTPAPQHHGILAPEWHLGFVMLYMPDHATSGQPQRRISFADQVLLIGLA